MQLTIFRETLPYKKSELINPKSLPSYNAQTLKSLEIELAQRLNTSIDFVEDTGDNFPSKGIVIYYPYGAMLDEKFLSQVVNPKRLLIICDFPFPIRKFSESAVPSFVLAEYSLHKENYPHNFWLAGNESIAKEMADVGPTAIEHGFVMIDHYKLTTLTEAMAWCIKELDKSGLVKE